MYLLHLINAANIFASPLNVNQIQVDGLFLVETDFYAESVPAIT